MRGNLLISLVSGKNTDEIRIALNAIGKKTAATVSDFCPTWGVSSVSGGSGDTRASHREAAIALLATTKLSKHVSEETRRRSLKIAYLEGYRPILAARASMLECIARRALPSLYSWTHLTTTGFPTNK
ncbi:hypothetical protein [Paraburkholderia sp. JHI869]|uniref:hypothetical protein n=1 Tax=Paraburkholderia sp. JHI869 TaxID=3112959 RepID=UPI00318064EB